MVLLLLAAHAYANPTTPGPAPSQQSTGSTPLQAVTDRVGACDMPPWMAPPYRSTGLDDADLERLGRATGLARFHTPTMSPFAYDVLSRAGGYDWSVSDQAVRALQIHGIGQLATIRPASRTEGLQPAAHLPADPVAYSVWVQAMVERYDGDGVDDMPGLEIPVKHWEIDNEPSQGRTHVPFYVDLVVATAAAVRAADPDAVVLNGGAAPVRGPASERKNIHRIWAFWSRAIELGVLVHVDAFNVHSAPAWSASSPERLEAVWRAKVGDALPMWLTEGGPTDVSNRAVSPDAAGQVAWLSGWLDEALPRYERVFLCDVPSMTGNSDWLDAMAEANERPSPSRTGGDGGR